MMQHNMTLELIESDGLYCFSECNVCHVAPFFTWQNHVQGTHELKAPLKHATLGCIPASLRQAVLESHAERLGTLVDRFSMV